MTVLVLDGVDRDVVAALAAAGVATDRGPLAAGPGDAPLPGAVVAPDEDTRCRIEDEHPDLVGRVHVAASLDQWLPRVRPAAAAPDAVRLGITGYNLKFLEDLLAAWRRDPRLAVDVDRWAKFRHHDQDATLALLADSEVVLAEWCGPNAVLASRHKRAGQRLVVRLHRFELYEPEWREVDIDAVDVVVTVGPAYRRMVLAETGWPPDKVVVVPNPVDVLHLDRPKHPWARHTLGMLSVDRSRKRLDRALDVLADLRAEDPRWTLRCKGTSPWDSGWVADRDDEVAYFAAQRTRIETDPLLADAVVFDPGGPDVAAWLRHVGFVLSPSDDESFHLAPAEGMASRAVPVLWPWEGADEVHHPRWVLPADGSREQAVARIRAAGADPAEFARQGDRAHGDVAARYRFEDVVERFTQLLLGAGTPPDGH